MVELLRKLKVMNEGLIADWERSESNKCFRPSTATESSSSRRFYSRKSSAHNVEGETSEGSRSPSPTQDAYAIDSRRRNETRDKWPRGGTWDGYSFKRDDYKESEPPPRDQGCWICTSPRHVHRDCPHYQKWESMRRSWLGKGQTGGRPSTRHVTMLAEANETDDVSRLEGTIVKVNSPATPAASSILDDDP